MENDKQYEQEIAKDDKRVYYKLYRENNRAKLNKYQNEYRKKNKDKVKQWTINYYKNLIEKLNQQTN